MRLFSACWSSSESAKISIGMHSPTTISIPAASAAERQTSTALRTTESGRTGRKSFSSPVFRSASSEVRVRKFCSSVWSRSD